MDENRLFFNSLIAVVVCITVVLFTLIVTDYTRKKLYVENGYEQVMTTGSSEYMWQKVKK